MSISTDSSLTDFGWPFSVSCGRPFAGSEGSPARPLFHRRRRGSRHVIVTPVGESILIDSGYPDNNGRDRDRILEVLRNDAGLESIDHAAVTHWHLDHYGNHAALASEIDIEELLGSRHPRCLAGRPESSKNESPITGPLRKTIPDTQGRRSFDLHSNGPPLKVEVVTASREVIPNGGQPNPSPASTNRRRKTPATTPPV